MTASRADAPRASGDGATEAIAAAMPATELAAAYGATPDGPADVGSGTDGAMLPPLAVSALMVTKADLIAALRVYVPHLSDVEMIEGERFLLTMGPEHSSTNGSV